MSAASPSAAPADGRAGASTFTGADPTYSKHDPLPTALPADGTPRSSVAAAPVVTASIPGVMATRAAGSGENQVARRQSRHDGIIRTRPFERRDSAGADVEAGLGAG